MTAAERKARSRAMWRTRLIARHPEGFVHDIARKLDELNDVDVVAADNALALIARDVAKRRKARAQELAQQRRAEAAHKRRLRQTVERRVARAAR